MPLLILSILIQVSLVLHIVKSGRSTTWIWIVVMLPMAGSIAYFILEVIPDLSSSRVGRSAQRKVTSVVNPNKSINAAAEKYSGALTVATSTRLAEECMKKGLFSDARDLYQKSLVGLHEHEPDLMIGLARAEFELGHYDTVTAILDALIEANPHYKNQNAHLLYARALQGSNKISAASHEYEVLYGYYSGPEAAYYYALFFKAQQQVDRAKQLLQEILAKAKRSGKAYGSLHAEIIRNAKMELTKL